MKVLVLGGYGAVGGRVVEELRSQGVDALSAGRDRSRADRVIDLSRPESVGRELSDVDVVVNASGIEEAEVVAQLASHAAVVDITATAGYIADLEGRDVAYPVLVSVGLAPGLTNLLAAAVHRQAPAEPIEIVLLLGTGERHGEASIRWAYSLLGKPFPDPGTGRSVRNYTGGRRFALPGRGTRRLVRADYSDQHVLTRDLGVPVTTYFGLDSRLMTTALSALTWVPGASRTPHLRLSGSEDWLALARTAGGGRGEIRWATGTREAVATASIAALAARRVTHLPAGVHHLHHVAALDDLATSDFLTQISDRDPGPVSGRGRSGSRRPSW